jgi:hypothetical protein
VLRRMCLPPRPSYPPTLLMNRDKTRHAALRRTIGLTLSGSAMNQFEPVLKRYQKRFLKRVEEVAEENKGIVDMNDWFNRFSFDVFPFWRHLTELDCGCTHLWTRFWSNTRRRNASCCDCIPQRTILGPNGNPPFETRLTVCSSNSSPGGLNSVYRFPHPKS